MWDRAAFWATSRWWRGLGLLRPPCSVLGLVDSEQCPLAGGRGNDEMPHVPRVPILPPRAWRGNRPRAGMGFQAKGVLVPAPEGCWSSGSQGRAPWCHLTDAAGDTAGVGICGCHVLAAILLAHCHPPWFFASTLDTVGLRAASSFRPREPRSLLPPQNPQHLVPRRCSLANSTHTCVCVSLAPSGCQPCWTPPVAPCSWRRCRRPEGWAPSCPGP